MVDGQGETPLMTDGPYLETKEVIGGFWVIDTPDLDVALKLAAEYVEACRGKVQVRPFDGLAEQGRRHLAHGERTPPSRSRARRISCTRRGWRWA